MTGIKIGINEHHVGRVIKILLRRTVRRSDSFIYLSIYFFLLFLHFFLFLFVRKRIYSLIRWAVGRGEGGEGEGSLFERRKNKGTNE